MGMLSRVIGWWAEDLSRASRAEIIQTLCGMHPLLRTTGEGTREEES
jgi:hypothetical protein